MWGSGGFSSCNVIIKCPPKAQKIRMTNVVMMTPEKNVWSWLERIRWWKKTESLVWNLSEASRQSTSVSTLPQRATGPPSQSASSCYSSSQWVLVPNSSSVLGIVSLHIFILNPHWTFAHEQQGRWPRMVVPSSPTRWTGFFFFLQECAVNFCKLRKPHFKCLVCGVFIANLRMSMLL